MTIDINQVEEDVMEEHVAPENEDARDMLERLSQKIMWKSAKEVYLEWILREIKHIQDIPEGFSLFCTLWEASKVKQYMLLSQDEQDKLNIKETYDKKEKENLINEEPIPKNYFCYICQQNFEDYLSHLESKDHKANNVVQNNS